jgi:hypothetical protein
MLFEEFVREKPNADAVVAAIYRIGTRQGAAGKNRRGENVPRRDAKEIHRRAKAEASSSYWDS